MSDEPAPKTPEHRPFETREQRLARFRQYGHDLAAWVMRRAEARAGEGDR